MVAGQPQPPAPGPPQQQPRLRVAQAFVSCGVNRVVHALDWGSSGLIAYAGHNMVCVYDPQASEVVGTLVGHTAQVMCVRWLPAAASPLPGVPLLLSGAADASIRLWAWLGRQHSPPWCRVAELTGHQSPVTSLAVHLLPEHSCLLLASTSADPVVRLWSLPTPPPQQQAAAAGEEQQQQLEQAVGTHAWQPQPAVPGGGQVLQHCVALAALPEDPDCLVMATGGTDSTVRLFVMDASAAAARQQQQQQELPPFQLQCQLKGHENWVKDVAFTCVREPAAAHAGAEEQQQGGSRLSLLLASAGQDRYARVWAISTGASTGANGAAAADGSGSDALRSLITRYAPRPHISAGAHTYYVTLEALLIGHEDWVNSVVWRPEAAAAAAAGAPQAKSEAVLLTASQDRSMMLWVHDTPSGLWLSDAVVGDAGSSCLGFYGGAFDPAGQHLVAHGFTGALHLWQEQQQHGAQQQQQHVAWAPRHALGGHYGQVLDVCWGGDGGCLQSVAADQTARLFTAVRSHWFELARTQVHGHDFSCLAAIPAAPPLQDSSGSGSSSLPPCFLQYASGSEEKVLRVFDAPHAFTESLLAMRGSHSPAAAAAVGAALQHAAASSSTRQPNGAAAAAAHGSNSSSTASRGRALGASVAALGLSNKAVYGDDDGDDGAGAGDSQQQASAGGCASAAAACGPEAYTEGPDFVPCAAPSVVSAPPLEEHLAQNTLWPEVVKLYGHGNDVFCVAAAPGGALLASACRAQSAGAAGVLVWEVGSWRRLAALPAHTLTVTQLQFSPDGRHLLSGSRDRSFSVWRVPSQQHVDSTTASSSGAGGFELVGRLKAAHSRIIWGVSWSHDGRHFVTGSRDQSVKVWALAGVGAQQQQPQQPILCLPPFAAGITAVALAPAHACQAGSAQQQQQHLLAVGLENGCVQVWRLSLPCEHGSSVPGGAEGGEQQQAACEQLWASRPWEQHAASVRRVCWAPACAAALCGSGSGEGSGGDEQVLFLGSCGEDHSVRVFAIRA